MEAMILDRNFAAQCIIDAFESFIWTDRYNETGDFEIYMPIAKAPLAYIVRENYIWIEDSDRLQVIEDIEIETDAEDGDHIKFTGRTLECILERHIVYRSTTINGPLQNGLQQLFNENAISPSEGNRRISKLRFIWNDDPRIAKLTMTGTFFGENLLDICETYCKLYELGFKMIYNESTETFDFSLYYGEDRSYAQEKLPWVVFSTVYNNLVGSNYFESFRDLKTAAVVASDYDSTYGQEVVYIDKYPHLTGQDRRELFVDGSSIRWEVEEPDEDAIEEEVRNSMWAHIAGRTEKEIQDRINQYIRDAWDEAIEDARQRLRDELNQLGEEKLAETFITKTFEGEIEALRQYVYGVDFFIGDVVQVRNQYGKEASSRITEVVRSHDIGGYTLSPTFTTLIGSDNEGNVANPDI